MQKMDNQEAVVALYKQIRNNVLDISDTFVSLALVLAGFFVGIKLIRLSYDTMSDEQGSGLGGVKLSQIIGPIIIIALIAGYKFVIGGLDFSVGVVVNKIADTDVLQERLEKSLQEIKIQMDNVDDTIMQKSRNLLSKYETSRENLKKASSNTYTSNYGTVSANIGDPDRQAATNLKSEFKTGGEFYEYRYDDNKKDNWSAYKKVLIQYGKSLSRSERESKGNHGVIADLIGLVFNVVYLVMIGLANIFLCLLTLLGPFVLAFSLFEPWKNSFITFIGKYIEVSLWMIVAKLILWITDAAGCACTTDVLSEYAFMLADLMEDGASCMEGYYAFGRALTAINVIRIAGLLALFSVPDITSAIFNFGSGAAMGGATAGATGAIQTAVNAPGKLLGAGGKMVAHKKGWL